MIMKYFEKVERYDNGWVGELAEGYVTDNETFTVFAETKKELKEQAEFDGVHKMTEEEKRKFGM